MGRNGREKDEGKEERVHTGVKVFLAGIRVRFDSKELFFFKHACVSEQTMSLRVSVCEEFLSCVTRARRCERETC